MKKLALVIVVLLLLKVGVNHLEHSASLNGYIMGCLDAVHHIAEGLNTTVDEEQAKKACEDSMTSYKK